MQYSSKLLETICSRIFYLTELGRTAHRVTQGFTKFCLHSKKKKIIYLVKVKTMLQRKLEFLDHYFNHVQAELRFQMKGKEGFSLLNLKV